MENRKSYDVAVLGGGLTGFTAAVRCAQLGKKTALIEEHALGGAGLFLLGGAMMELLARLASLFILALSNLS